MVKIVIIVKKLSRSAAGDTFFRSLLPWNVSCLTASRPWRRWEEGVGRDRGMIKILIVIATIKTI